MLVEAVWYREGDRVMSGPLGEVVAAAEASDGFVWAGLHDPGPDEVAEVAAVFGLHDLAVEDAIKARQRPKVERYDDWLFVVLRTARYLDEPEEIDVGELLIFAGPRAIVVIRHGEPVPLAGLRARLERERDAIAQGPVGMLHAVIDEVVDTYQYCLTGLDDDVAEVELGVFSDTRHATDTRLIERIYFLHRETLELHRAMSPLTSAMPALRHDDFVAVDPAWDLYFRDVEDHLHRQCDQLLALRELLSAALTAKTSQIGIRQNEDMRRISAWVAIAAVPTMVAAVYGMNFEHMPELGWRAAYPTVVGFMLVACGVLYRLFRRSGWL